MERKVLEEEFDRGGYIPVTDDNLLNELPTVSKCRPAFQSSQPPTLLEESQKMTSTPVVTVASRIPTHVFATEEAAPIVLLKEPHQTTSSGKLVPYVVSSRARSEIDLPKVEFLKSSGNPMTYTRFMSSFEANVEKAVIDCSKKLLLLIQHCDGEAKRLIEFC